YNVKVHVPEDVSELKSLTVTDKLDSRLDFVEATVKEDEDLTPTEKDRLVTLTLDEKALEKHAGKTLTLVITAKINETAKVGKDIDNIAELDFENKDGKTERYKTPPVPVTPEKPQDPQEPKDPKEPKDPEKPTDPKEPSKPIEPNNSIDPNNPVDPTESVKRFDSDKSDKFKLGKK